MSSMQIPGGPDLASTELGKRFTEAPAGRRDFLRRAAGLGLAAPLLNALATGAAAQESGHTDHDQGTPPADGYVGSDPQSPSTGDASPVPTGQPVFSRYDPVLAPSSRATRRSPSSATDASVSSPRTSPSPAGPSTAPFPAGRFGWSRGIR